MNRTIQHECCNSRLFMTQRFLTQWQKREHTLKDYAKAANISERTIYYLQSQNKLISLPNLCLLFSTTLTQGMLTTPDIEFLINQIICDSLPEDGPHPILKLVSHPQEENEETEESRKQTTTLSEFMKSLRTEHLNISARETTLCFQNCTPNQLKAIETDCCGVNISTICKLFNNYQCSKPSLPNHTWGTFATLVLKHLLPLVKDYAIEFVGWKQ